MKPQVFLNTVTDHVIIPSVNLQDFEACEQTQPSMSSKPYVQGGALVPSEHHIAEFHQWWSDTMG